VTIKSDNLQCTIPALNADSASSFTAAQQARQTSRHIIYNKKCEFEETEENGGKRKRKWERWILNGDG